VATVATGLEDELHALRALLAPHIPLLAGGTGAATVREIAGLPRVRDLTHWRALLRLHVATSPE
jgi:hypothetical protein